MNFTSVLKWSSRPIWKGVCVLGLALGLTNIYLLNLTYDNNTVEMVLKTHLERRVLGLVLAGGDEPRGRSERMCTRKTHHF